MPAKSKAQKVAMQIALAVKKGDTKATSKPPSVKSLKDYVKSKPKK